MRFRLVSVSAVVLVALAACTSDEPSPATATPTPVLEPSSFERILHLMPDTPESRAYTRINRFKDIAAAHGLAVPAEDASQAEIDQYSLELIVRGRQTGLPLIGEDHLSGFHRDYADQTADTLDSIGFDARHVEMTAMSGESAIAGHPPLLEVVVGDFDASLARSLLDECATCAAQPETKITGDTEYYSWGSNQNLRNRFGAPMFDVVGRGGSLYVEDEFAIRSLHDREIEAAIQASAGVVLSLGDQEDWLLAARAVDEMGALSASITSLTDVHFSDWKTLVGLSNTPISNLDPETVEALERFDDLVVEVGASAPALPAYDLVATGTGIENGRVFAAIAVVFPDEVSASEATEVLEARVEQGLTMGSDIRSVRWSDLIESSDISATGRVVRARIVPVETDSRVPSNLGRFVATYPFATEIPWVQFLLR